ncbi:MAG TPA: hypothetical protein QGH10_19605 [Armatimonadota bacterium]|nr:hypothetical protein [Armatimonadota bacterium]
MMWLRALMERFKNPWAWAARAAFAVTLCLGIWWHNWAWIIVSTLLVASGPFWFPKQRRPHPWAEDLVDNSVYMIERAELAIKVAVVMLGGAIFGALVYGLWTHDAMLTIGGIMAVAVMKTWILREPIRKTMRAA